MPVPTIIQVGLDVPTNTGVNDGASGALYWTPTHRKADGEREVLPKSFNVQLVDGTARVPLTPGYWKVDEVGTGAARQVRTVLVPESATPVLYQDLVDVDPATLEPSEAAVPAWTAAVNAVTGQAAAAAASATSAAGSAGSAGASAAAAEVSRLAAEQAATDAAEDAADAITPLVAEATAARDEAVPAAVAAERDASTAQEARDAAAGFATDAGGSATSASGSATTATGAATTATDAATTATGAASTSTGAAATAEAARDAALAALIIGAGRPDIPGTLTTAIAARVAAAAPGAVFRSTDGPQGAWVWMKRGFGWTCVDGDTGWRAIPLSVPGHPGLTEIRIRRAGLDVSVSLSESVASGAGAATGVIYSLPAGFTKPSGLVFSAPVFSASSAVPLIDGSALYIGTAQSTDVTLRRPQSGRIMALGRFNTYPLWPTTLPGTAV